MNGLATRSPLAISRRDLRLGSGLVLFAYVTLHLTCHALGLVSMPVADAALAATVRLWRSLPGTLLLYGAAAVHVALAMLAVYDRRSLRLPPIEWLRIVLGFVMPIGLIGHVVVTRYAFERYGLPGDYARVVGGLWGRGAQGLSFGLLAPGWIHGCLGLRFAFGHRPTWQRLRPVLFGIALLLPVLAALGFVTLGRQIDEHPRAVDASRPVATVESAAALEAVRDRALSTYAGVLALIVLGRFGRRLREHRRRSVVWLSYPDRRVSVPRGWSVLDASRSFGIPHTSACGGRGRCTTCRVRVTRGEANCPPVGADERRALGRIEVEGHAVRLACQLRPTGDVSVEPMLTVAEPPRSRNQPPTVERFAAVVRLRVRVTAGAAHDELHALRACLRITQRAAAAHQGTVCNRAGADALIAFDAGDDPRRASRRAMSAADDIGVALGEWAARLASELDLAPGYRMALHVGPVVIGPLGDAQVALGEAVVEADRLAARDGRCVVSTAALRSIGRDDADVLDVAAGRLAEALATARPNA